MKLKKGSPEAKAYMARLRALAASRRRDPVRAVKDHFGYKNPGTSESFGGEIVLRRRLAGGTIQVEKTPKPVSIYGRDKGCFVATIFVGQHMEQVGAFKSLREAVKAGASAMTRQNPARGAKALDKQIEQAYYRVASGVQVGILDIPKIFRDAKELLASGRTDIDAVLVEVVKRYQHAGGGGRLLNNPPAFIVIDSKSGVVQFRKAASGMGTAAFDAAIERATDMAAKLGRSFLVFLDIRGYKVGARLALPMVRVSGATEVMPDGSVVRGNPKFKARFTASDGVETRTETIRAHGTRSAMKKAERMTLDMPHQFRGPRSEVEVIRCNPRTCKNPGHRHARKNPMLQMVTLANPRKRPADAPYCVMCGEWAKSKGPYKAVYGQAGWLTGKPLCRNCRAGTVQLQASGYDFDKKGYPSAASAPSRVSAIKARMVAVLKEVGKGLVDSESEAEFDREAAIYWFANDYHGGQGDALYSILSTSQYKPGPSVRSVKQEGPVAEAFYRALVSLQKKILKNPLNRWEAAQVLKQARYRLDMARSKKWKGHRDIFTGEATGMAAVVESRGPASARRAAQKMVRRAVGTRYGLKNNPGTSIPFKQGQIITVEQALAWAKKTGNASLVKQCQEAIALCKKANGPAQKVRFDLVQMGDPKKIESVMAGVEYGQTDETVYKPTKGSKKGQHLYRHEWGEGSGRRKPVPLIAPVGGKSLVMPLGKGQKATDWLRG